MTPRSLIELLVGLAFVAAGVWQYRRRSGAPNDSYGSQSAVLLLAVGAIVLIVALGGLEYRPTDSELEAARAQ